MITIITLNEAQLSLGDVITSKQGQTGWTLHDGRNNYVCVFITVPVRR
jgi:hypothetical protein